MAQEDGPTWRYLAIGAVTLVFSLVGYLVGNFISHVRDELAALHQVLDSRSSIPPRLEALERADADKESRLRTVEQDHWKQDHRR